MPRSAMRRAGHRGLRSSAQSSGWALRPRRTYGRPARSARARGDESMPSVRREPRESRPRCLGMQTPDKLPPKMNEIIIGREPSESEHPWRKVEPMKHTRGPPWPRSASWSRCDVARRLLIHTREVHTREVHGYASDKTNAALAMRLLCLADSGAPISEDPC